MLMSARPKTTTSQRRQPLSRRRMLWGVAAVPLAALGSAAFASSSEPTSPTAMSARLNHSRVLSYPPDQVWPATIRYLRVDRQFELVDRDQDAGFILFDFPVGDRPQSPRGRGSVELISTTDVSGRPAVNISISTDAGPVHLPHAIAEGLAAKLLAERGPPAPPPPKTPDPSPTPPPDDGPSSPW